MLVLIPSGLTSGDEESGEVCAAWEASESEKPESWLLCEVLGELDEFLACAPSSEPSSDPSRAGLFSSGLRAAVRDALAGVPAVGVAVVAGLGVLVGVAVGAGLGAPVGVAVGAGLGALLGVAGAAGMGEPR